MKLSFSANTVLNKLANAVEGVENESEMLLRLIIGLAVFLLLAIFRKQISKAIVSLVTKPIAKKSEKVCNSLRESMFHPFSFLVIVIGIYAASEIIAPTGEIRSTLLLILKLGTIICAAWFAIAFIGSDFSVISKEDDSKTKKTAITFIGNFTKALIIVIAVLLVLEQFGISASSIIATLGVGGVAVAFACKDAIENMISGFIIIFDKPFEVGDSIQIDGDIGTVEDIKIRTTRLRLVDGTEKVYPNTSLTSKAIINISNMDKRSFNETLWIEYKHSGVQVEKYCEDLKQLILKYDCVIPDDVRVNFLDYGSDALEINIFFYVTIVNYAQYQEFKSKINSDIKSFTDSSDINMAFKSRTIYIAENEKDTDKSDDDEQKSSKE
ncbi:MAG: mechanosensitive ion channel family protein [Clostridiales bacterium]|nr:mechanosensitive ion channel family protein [Clostridiales bacterium]